MKIIEQQDIRSRFKKSAVVRSVTALATLGVLVLEFGFEQLYLPQWLFNFLEILGGLVYLGANLYNWMVEEPHEFNWRKPLLDISLLAIMFFSFLFVPAIQSNLPVHYIDWRIYKIYLFAVMLFYMARLSVTAAASGRAPTRALLASFLVIIVTGSLLLMLPAASTGEPLSFTDAFFTSTSATCVTGLVVKDTGLDFTRFGQIVILILIQVGGLGIMIFGAVFALLMGSRLTLRESVAIRDIMNEQAHGQIGRITVFICISTLLLEAIGASGLYGIWQTSDATGGQLFQSIFHSISAFCNAGFALQGDSLSKYRSHWQIYLFVCPLIILGGLGFPVLSNLWQILRDRIRRMRKKRKVAPVRLSLHSRLVLISSLFLLVFGWEVFVILEKVRPVPPDGIVPNITYLDSLFNSITARTAGFNTVNIADLSAGSKLVLMFLMSIGGSPSSTAGGIKTIAFAVMVLSVFSTISGRQKVHVFRRAIPVMVIRRSATIFMLYGMLIWGITLLLTVTRQSYSFSLIDLIFETCSALGTVGLSTGLTPDLPIAGKWIIIMAMVVGRLGPVSLLAALTLHGEREDYDYPMEPLVVG